MPILKNQRHERFAQELAKGKSQADAYNAAGYEAEGNSAEAAASRLLRNVKISERVAELQERGAKRAEVTVESLITEAEEARKLAMAIEQPSAAVAAIREKGVLSGRRIERSEQGLPGEFSDLDEMSPDELRAHLAAESKTLSLRGEEIEEAGGMREAGKQLH